MRPQDILPDDASTIRAGGLDVRKGTIAAFLANAAIATDAARADSERGEALRCIAEALPALNAVRLFETLEVRDPGLRAFITQGVNPLAPPGGVGEAVDLKALYAPPSPLIQKAVTSWLTEYHHAYLKAATFFCLATAHPGAGMDASPRGGPAGFVRMLDERTVAFADWPGNNRIESLTNLQSDDRVAMLFIFPGLDVFMRINGRAHATVEPALLQSLAEAGKTPKAAIVVRVDEALFHCGKAINRARLWEPASKVARSAVPTVGTVLVALAELKDVPAAALDAKYEEAVKHELY